MDHHELDCDVLVAGGGAAGVPCALAAARCGARVILCQDRAVLGGNASSEVRMHIVGADASGGRGQQLATEAREGGLMEEIRLETTARNPQRSAAMLDLILYEMCRGQDNLTLMLNTTVTGVEKDGDRMTHALAERQSTEDSFRIAAPVFIDCTGDGRLGAEAGAPFRRGREGRDEFGEERALDRADDKTLGSSILMMARRHDRPMPFVAPPWARKFTEEDLRLRPHATGGVDRGLEYGYWWAEWGGQLDTIKDNETIRDELLGIVLGIWDHIKNGEPATDASPSGESAEGRLGSDREAVADHIKNGEPGGSDGAVADHIADSRNWALDWFGFLPGKRESRRFVGQHVLTEADVMKSQPCDDAIAYGGWPVDTHPPEGVDAPGTPPCTQDAVPYLYDIPLRACVSRDVPNLMFAGRNISATHVAFASTRVMATCAAMGQGVGTAAAYAAHAGLAPGELAASSVAIAAIQQRLLRDDAYLIGCANLDGGDVAPGAAVSASSARGDGAPEGAVSGHTRADGGERGAHPDRAAAGTQRWISDPAAGLPAWLELRWEKPVTPRQVRLVFDTGMHRPLTLSHSDAFAQRMEWGRPQSETVRDYVLQGEVDGAWVELARAEGNYQRLRVHDLEAAPAVSALRLCVEATNGVDEARVCGVRVYEQAPGW